MEISDIHPQGSPSPQGHGHEDRGAKVKYVLIFAAGLAAVVVAFQLALGAWLAGLRDDRERTVADRPELLDDDQGLYPGPQLQDTATGDMKRMARDQARALDSYGWVEPGKIARIPIRRALEIVAEQGLGTVDTKLDESAEVPEAR